MSNNIKIIGLYDPQRSWIRYKYVANSNGDQLKNIFTNLAKIEFSNDAIEIMNISMLTNAYLSSKNISEKNF